MKIRYHITLIILTAATMLPACKKDKEASESGHEPVVTFISPVQSQELDEKDTLWIRVNLTSEDDLHEYLVEVRNNTTGKMVYTYEGHSHDKTADINLYFLPDVTEDADLQLTVTTLDHNSNKNSRSIIFRVNNTVESVRPAIVITAPGAAMYNNGQTVSLSGAVSHIRTLKEVKIELTRNNNTVFSYTPNVSGLDSMRFDTTYLIHATEYSEFELVVTASDMNDNTSVKTRAFHMHP